MTPATIIREAQAEGVRLTLSPTGTIKATGDGAAVNRWLTVIRKHKAEIIDVLEVSAGETAITSRSGLIAPMTAHEETAIRNWWGLIGETDPACISQEIQKCQQDIDARNYFAARAALELPTPPKLHELPRART